MYKKIKNALRKILILFVVFSLLNPFGALADVLKNEANDDGDPVFNGFFISIEKQIGGGIFTILDPWGGETGSRTAYDVYAIVGFTVDHGVIDFNANQTDYVWKGDNNSAPVSGFQMPQNNNEWVCIADKRIAGFCDAIRNACGVSNPGDSCGLAMTEVWDEKMKNILQAELDAKINNAGLDKEKANDAIESCGGDLGCIDKVLGGLANDPSFAQGSASGSTGSLTVEDLSDLINSDSEVDIGPLNSIDNDPMNMLGKNPGPKVDVAFNSNPSITQVNTRVTATALPSFFNSENDKLYFTWYLKRENCGLSNSSKPGDLSSCDLDFDEKITVNDWKIAAAKINVSKDYDSSNEKYSSFSSGMDSKSSAYTAVPEFKKTVNETEDNNIGWRKDFLRDEEGKLYEYNDADDAENCYIQGPKSGRTYELRKTEYNFPENECPEGYHRACVSNQEANCPVLNPEFSQDDADAAAAAIPPVEYLIPKSKNQIFSACAISSIKGKNDNENESKDVVCSIQSEEDLKRFEPTVSCGDGKKAICMKDGADYGEKKNSQSMELKNVYEKALGIIVGTSQESGSETLNNDMICSAVAKKDPSNNGLYLPNTNPLFDSSQEDCNYLTNNLINGSTDEDGTVLINENSYLEPKCEFKKGNNLCKHLFPKLPKKAIINDKEFDLSDEVSGDGKFSLSEKAFWGADTAKPSTTDSAVDEARVVGLGVDTFEWAYSPGDKIGVVVEGESSLSNTEHPDSTFKRMWALPTEKCKALEELEEDFDTDENDPGKNSRGFYREGDMGILTAQVDLDDCLEENLLDPDVTGTSKLKVDLVANPDNPINSPDGRGDVLNIVSNPANLQNNDGLLYKWSVQKSIDGSNAPIDTTNWQNITDVMLKSESFSQTDLEGLNKKELAIKLNLKEEDISKGMKKGLYNGGVFYLKIRLRIIGTSADGNQNAEGSVIVRVKNQEEEMLVYNVSADDNGMLNMISGDKSLEICADKIGKDNCYISKNNILGLEIPNKENKLSNFSWKVNGNDISCNSSISSSCVNGGNKLFIPILGNENEAIDVVATALKTLNNRSTESIEVGRHFVITSNQLQISSADPNSFCSLECLNSSSMCPKYLGHYNNLNGSKVPDCSYNVWETREGKTVNIQVYGQTGFEWAVDGRSIPELNDKNQIQLKIDKSAGDNYNIGVTTRVLPGSINAKNNIRKALYKNWGVSPEEAIEEIQSANIQLNVLSNPYQDVAVSNKSFAASLITHFPQQFMFLFKIFITSTALLFSMSLLFAIIPEASIKRSL